MNRFKAIVLLFAVGCNVCAGSFSEGVGDYATDYVLVKFKPAAVEMQMVTTPSGQALTELVQLLGLPAGSRLSEPQINKLFAPASSLGAPNLDRFLYLHLAPGLTVEAALERLNGHPLIEYAEPDWIIELGWFDEEQKEAVSSMRRFEPASDENNEGIIPNDPFVSSIEQWHHAELQMFKAWTITQGSTNVIVANIDYGVIPYEELEGRLVPGYNFYDNSTNTIGWDSFIGTAHASFIAANANNGLWGAGIDWNCRIMPVVVYGISGRVSFSVQGIDYAVSNGCKVISYLSRESPSISLNLAVSNAISHGVLFVTGRSGTNIVGSISSGALGRTGYRYYNEPPNQLLMAPARFIFTPTAFVTNRVSVIGLSSPGPVVAGVCSLLASIRPDITQDQARLILCWGAEDQVGWPDIPSGPVDTPGYDPYYGWGRVNAYYSLLLAQTRIDRVQFTPDDRLELSWKSPTNAGQKQPYAIERSSSLTGPWAKVDSGQFRYESDRTYWLEEQSQNTHKQSRFYRVTLKELPKIR